jgi:hypothetical protein
MAICHLLAITPFNENNHYPNVIIVCFDANAINTATGDINITKNDNEESALLIS